MSGLKILLQKKFLNKKNQSIGILENPKVSWQLPEVLILWFLKTLIFQNLILELISDAWDSWLKSIMYTIEENYKLFLNVIQRWNYSRSFNWLLSYQLSITYCYLIVYRTKSCLNTQNCTCIKKGWKKGIWLVDKTNTSWIQYRSDNFQYNVREVRVWHMIILKLAI